MICDECETVAHCSKHGCIPKQPDYEGAIEVSVIFHEGQRMFAVPKQPAQQTCNCRWEGEVQVQQCTLHESHLLAIHEWAGRAKAAEAKLAQQPAPVGEPTKAMIDAAERIDWSDSDVRGNIVNMWQAMCAVAEQPAQQEPVVQAWSEGYRAGVADERTSEANIGIAGMGMKVEPARNNPYLTFPQPAQQEPWGFHIQFNNGKDATFKGLDYLAECEAHLEAGETITMLYIKENT